METIRNFNDEQASIEAYLQESATAISKREFSSGILTVWKNSESLPSRKICSFVSAAGELEIPNSNEKSFQKVLLTLKENSVDSDDFCTMLTAISPDLRRVIKKPLPYMERIIDVWLSPTLSQGRFEAFVENLTTGKVEFFTIDADSVISIKNIGEGIKFSLM